MSDKLDFSFDGKDNTLTRPASGGDAPCSACGKPGHEHQKERVTDGEGRFYYRYLCT